jgi:hypothetical protein
VQGMMDLHPKRVLKAGAGTSGWAGAMTGLREYDVADKISDPAVHRYLHEGEKTGNIEPAYQTDRNRLDARLREFGELEFQRNSDAVLETPGRLPILLGELNRLGIPEDLALLHPMESEGSVVAGGSQGLARRRAADVKQRLQAAGIANPLSETTAGASTFAGVHVKAAAADPNIVDIYVRKWSRISAAHEFGHMIGLMDEYYAAKSDEVVRQLISAGLLPPDTRGDHLTANPPTSHVGETRGQKATMKLLEANELDTPDFTLQDLAKSSSIMTGGYDVVAAHFVTVWEALASLTEAHLERKYWRIQ